MECLKAAVNRALMSIIATPRVSVLVPCLQECRCTSQQARGSVHQGKQHASTQHANVLGVIRPGSSNTLQRGEQSHAAAQGCSSSNLKQHERHSSVFAWQPLQQRKGGRQNA